METRTRTRADMCPGVWRPWQADVGDEAEARILVERIRAELPPLAGVAHLAGVLDDALISQQSLESFRTTLAPKAFTCNAAVLFVGHRRSVHRARLTAIVVSARSFSGNLCHARTASCSV